MKVIFFIFFTLYRSAEWPADETVKGIALISGDSPQYYKPLESLMQGEGYQSLCRMPGLLPFYAPLRLVMSEENTKVSIVFIQLLFDVFASLMLAITAARVFGSDRVFRWVAVVYGLSTFVSIRSHYLLSDSFNTSMLIISFYFLGKHILYHQKKDVLLAGVFMVWSLFFRPVVVLAYPCAVLLFFFYHQKKLLPTLKSSLFFVAPTIVALSLWTIRNISSYDRPIILIASANECMNKFTPQQEAVRHLIITMGEDFQPWSAGSGAEWFLQKDKNYKEQHPFSANDFASTYTIDSLILLKENYMQFKSLAPDDSMRTKLGERILTSANAYAAAYKSEHAVNYWVINRIRFIRMFLFPNRLDDLPLPAVQSMNILQKGAKAASYFLLLGLHALAGIAMLYFLFKKKWKWFVWGLLPFAFVVVLGYLGYIEQRYLTVAYPFMVMLAVGFISSVLPIFKKV